ncbi:hypothetical protein [Sporolactobacillus pectinivorans]|nr:hypothetical protein [Sporolactobacillus pectinivorans]
MEITKNEFGVCRGHIVWQYCLTNNRSVRIKVMNYGHTEQH